VSETVEKQLDVLISLMARRDPGIAFMHRIVTRGKKDPAAYIRAYNALDGSLSVTEAAKIAGVTIATMSEILQGWRMEGIIYDVSGTAGKPLYKRLVVLPITLREQ